MGEGISLSLPRNGFLVATILVVSVPFSREHGFVDGFNMLVIENLFFSSFHKRFIHCAGVDLGYGKASGRRKSAFTGASSPGRRNLGYTGDVRSRVPDLPEIRVSQPDLGDNGS